MRAGQFIKEKALSIISMFVFLAAVFLLGFAFHIQEEYIVAITVCFLLLAGMNLLGEFLKKRNFYNDFLDKLQQLDQKYLITEMIRQPEFLEGEILCDALYEIDKSMNERINHIEVAQRDFKEYVEMWIHEIKVPIATLSCMNYNDGLEAADDRQEQGQNDLSLERQGSLSKQKQQIDKLNYYVEQILFLARADNPQKDYLMKKVSLEQVVNQVIRNNKELIRGNKISIEKEELSVSVTSDAKWLGFVLGQIVNNSVKYIVCKSKLQKEKELLKDVEGEDIVQLNGMIRFESFEYKDRCELVITDDGIGISKQDLPRVFDKTFTGENGRKVTGSTGMGLYICKKLCDKLGHKIWIESEEGEYTKVHVEFGKENYYSQVE